MRRLLTAFTFVRRFWLLVLLLAPICGAVGIHFYAERQFSAAEKALNEQQYADARDRIAFCVNVWPRDADAYWLAARIERFNAEYGRAEHYLGLCSAKESKQTTRTQLEWTLLRAERGEVDRVAEGLRNAIDHGDPETPMILETLCRVYLRQGRLPEALATLDQWTRADPANARVFSMRGQVKQRMGKSAPALSDYERSLELDPSRYDTRLQTADLLIQLSRVQEAGTQVRYLAEHFPDGPDVKLVAARLLTAEGKYDKARKILLDAAERYPTKARVLLNLAEAEYGMDRFADAEKHLEQILEQDHAVVEAYWLLIQAKTRLGRPESGIKFLKKRWKTLGDAHARLDSILKHGIGPGAAGAAAACEAGQLFMVVGEDGKATEWLYQALARDPNYLPAHEALVTLYEKSGATVKQLELHRARARELKKSGKRASPDLPGGGT
jgi:tetratricopeptide (TPR) repeat protein